MKKWLRETFHNKAQVVNYPCLDHSQLFDWWQEERQAIAKNLRADVAQLKKDINQEIDKINIVEIEALRKFEKNNLEPKYETWFTQTYQNLSYNKQLLEFGKVRDKDIKKTGEFDLKLTRNVWVALNAMKASTYAPLIALPAAGSAFSVSNGVSFLGFTIVAPVLTIAVVPSLIAVTALSTFAAGQYFKSKNKATMAKAYKDKIAQNIELYVFGDHEKPEIDALSDVLIKELDILFDLKLLRLQEGQS